MKKLALLFLLLGPHIATGQMVSWISIPTPESPVTGVVMGPDSLFHMGSYVLNHPGSDWTFAPGRAILTTPPGSIVASFGDSLYSVGSDSLYFSKDYGATWQFLAALPPTKITTVQRTLSGVLVARNGSGKYFVSRNNFSTFDTASFPALSPSTLNFYIDADNLFYTSLEGEVRRSTDYGKTWTTVLTLNNLSFNPALAFANGYVIATGYKQRVSTDTNIVLAESYNGGLSWTTLKPPSLTAHVTDVALGFGTELFAVAPDSLGSYTVYKSVDGGLHWLVLFNKLYPATFHQDRNHTLIALNASNVWFYSTNGGTQWDTLRAWGIHAPIQSMVSVLDTLFITTPNGLFASGDRGSNWVRRTSTNGLIKRGFNGSLVLGALSVSVDGGRTFKATKPPTGANAQRSVITNDGTWWLAYIANSNRLWSVCKSTDTGRTWSASVGVPNPVLDLVGTADSNIIVVSGTSMDKWSDPFGAVTDTRPVDANPSGALAMDSSGTIYTALRNGHVYRSYDQAMNWDDIASPSPDSNVLVAGLTGGPRRFLFSYTRDLTTQATKLFQLDFKDSTWNDRTVGMVRSGVAPLITGIYHVGKYVYATSSNLGLFRSVDTLFDTTKDIIIDTTHHEDTTSHPDTTHALVHDRLDREEIYLYPNPASNEVTVTGIDGSEAVVLEDIDGRVWSAPIRAIGKDFRIDISPIPNGMYFLKVGDQRRRIVIHR